MLKFIIQRLENFALKLDFKQLINAKEVIKLENICYNSYTVLKTTLKEYFYLIFLHACMS